MNHYRFYFCKRTEAAFPGTNNEGNKIFRMYFCRVYCSNTRRRINNF